MTNLPADHCAVCEMPDGDHLDWCTPQARLNAKYDPISREELIAECERLERERSEWASVAATRNLNIVLIAEERDAERQKRQSVELELDAALAKLQGLEILLRRATPYLRGTELRDQIYATLPDAAPAPACASNCASRKTDPYGFPYACDCTLTRG